MRPPAANPSPRPGFGGTTGDLRLGPIVLLGVPGAGKGTQAKRLVNRYAIPHISTGDMFRDMATSGSELGARVWADMKQGNLVSDQVVCSLMAERLQRDDCTKGYILDGFPRTVAQAEWVVEFLRQPSFQPKLVVIYLTVGYNDLYRRLLGRRSCPSCGRIYNDFTQPPRQPGICDLDKSPLVQRKDDDPDVIRERLSAYEKQTLPLVEFFRRQGVLVELNGMEPVDRVSEGIYAVLERGDAGRGRSGAQ